MVVVMIYVILVVIICQISLAFRPIQPTKFVNSRRAVQSSSLLMSVEGGKIVVSGIGKVEEDEFMLNLLNEQVRDHALVCFF